MSDDDHGVGPSEDAGGVSQEAARRRFPTVGIGTSAGGVHALQMFFESLPEDVEAAFVVIVHLDPSRPKRAFQHFGRSHENAGGPGCRAHAS